MNNNDEIKISIAEPCHENWDEMTSLTRGRFCGKCTKVVVDATALSPEEIFSVYKEKKGNVCMRLKTEYLDTVHTVNHSRWSFKHAIWNKAILFLGLQLIFLQQVKAQVKNAMGSIKNGNDEAKKYTRSSTVHGVIADSVLKEPLYRVEVIALRDDSVIAKTLTDIHGKFELKFNDNVPINARIDLLFQKDRYSAATINGFIINKQKVFMDTVLLRKSAILLKEVQIVKIRDMIRGEVVTHTSGIMVISDCGPIRPSKVPAIQVNRYFPNPLQITPIPPSPKIMHPEGSPEWFNDRQ